LSRVEKWIRWASKQGITAIRFTGGEPLLHPQLRKMAEIASRQGLYVTVNSNGLMPEKRYDTLSPFINMYKISLPAADEDTVERLTGVKGAFRKKIRTIAHCLSIHTEVQILTVILEDNIGCLEKFVKLCEGIPGLSWSPLRVEASPMDNRPISRGKMQVLAEELNNLMEKYPGKVHKLGLATPFCSVKPVDLGAKVFMGRGEDCGPFCSLTVNPDDQLIACYSCRRPLRSFTDHPGINEDPEYKRLTGMDQLPKMCRDCTYLQRCMGGCAAPDATVDYKNGKIDYLAQPF
jgi:radical SAM protein with 4Fe4S-binding SPASM domain